MALFPEEVSSDLNTWPPLFCIPYCSFLSQVQFVQPITTRHSMFLQSLLSAFVHLIFRVYANIYYFFLGQSEINREWPYWSYTLTSIQLTPFELAIGGFCISRLVSALFTKKQNYFTYNIQLEITNQNWSYWTYPPKLKFPSLILASDWLPVCAAEIRGTVMGSSIKLYFLGGYKISQANNIYFCF